VHSHESEAVESREAMTSSGSIQMPLVVTTSLFIATRWREPSCQTHQDSLSSGLDYCLQALGIELKNLQNVFHVFLFAHTVTVSSVESLPDSSHRLGSGFLA
jgi:hypothetical protein